MLNAVSFLFPDILPIHRIARQVSQCFWHCWGHISHMCLDHLRHLINGPCVFTIFVAPPSGETVALHMYFNPTFIDNYLQHSQLFAMTLQSRTLSLPLHITHSFRSHTNHCCTFIWTVCIHPGLRSQIQWETFLLGCLPIFLLLYIRWWTWYVVWNYFHWFLINYVKPRWRCP